MIDMSVTGERPQPRRRQPPEAMVRQPRAATLVMAAFRTCFRRQETVRKTVPAASLLGPLRLMMPKQKSMKALPAVSLSVYAIALAASR